MNTKNADILAAAKHVFSRYGYSKTTIGDIASEAGVARQTVYNAFPGKPDILRAVVRDVGAETLRNVQSAWQDAETLSQKLELFHNIGPLAWFETISQMPDAAEFIDGMHADAECEMAILNTSWVAAFDEMLEDTAGPGWQLSIPRTQFAEYFYSASINAKYGATDVKHLADRLQALRLSTLAVFKS